MTMREMIVKSDRRVPLFWVVYWGYRTTGTDHEEVEP
jgi:hypothetical protein